MHNLSRFCIISENWTRNPFLCTMTKKRGQSFVVIHKKTFTFPLF